MIVQKFNSCLEQYSHQLTHLRVLKSSLPRPTQHIFSYLFSLDINEQGYFTKDEIYHIWLQNEASRQQCGDFIDKYFEFEKVSYTIIQRFLRDQSHQETNQIQQTQQIQDTVKQIFSISFSIFHLQQQIISKMDCFIPMKYSRPTEQELTKYVLCQHITVDIKQVSNALNLLPTNHQHQKSRLNYDKTLCNPSVANLQDIMKRLQNRVNTFGKQWLNPK